MANGRWYLFLCLQPATLKTIANFHYFPWPPQPMPEDICCHWHLSLQLKVIGHHIRPSGNNHPRKLCACNPPRIQIWVDLIKQTCMPTKWMHKWQLVTNTTIPDYSYICQLVTDMPTKTLFLHLTFTVDMARVFNNSRL